MARTASLLAATPLYTKLRGIKRFLLPPTVRGELPPEQCRGTVAILHPPLALEAGSSFDVAFRIVNRAGVPWTSTGSAPVMLRCRWLSYRGDAFDAPPTFTRLPRPAYPGEPLDLLTTIAAPDVVGDFLLAVDLVQNNNAFAEVPPVSIAVPVIGPRATDIDYHAVYRTANLAENRWWVVGAYHSQEQYEKSCRERLAMLVQHGLTPDSRVLDVGCGTGQMAEAMQPYLSENGAYAGCDIGREAIEYCHRTFTRKNFRFRQSGMTTLPFDEDGTFDLAIFFSVFTHTFTDESALLLAETVRLLKPTGAIIADVITSPLVERGAGHRGEMQVNREHFLRLASMVGLTGEIIGTFSWNRYAERLMIRFRRA